MVFLQQGLRVIRAIWSVWPSSAWLITCEHHINDSLIKLVGRGEDITALTLTPCQSIAFWEKINSCLRARTMSLYSRLHIVWSNVNLIIRALHNWKNRSTRTKFGYFFFNVKDFDFVKLIISSLCYTIFFKF